MILKSKPIMLIFEGEIQRAVSITCSHAVKAVEVYALNTANQLVELGTLVNNRITNTQTPQLVCMWFELDTSKEIPDCPFSLTVVFDGTIAI